MNTTVFTTVINASAAKVWLVLWSDVTYRRWTSVFSESSHAVSDWNEGSKIQFLDGQGRGMHGVIEKKVQPSIMVFRHIGEIKDGQETVSDWGGAHESYFLTEENGQTTLRAELEMTEEFKSYFEKTFPLALQKVKEISEQPVELSIEARVQADPAKVWEYWTNPAHITQWNFAIDTWHCPAATNDLRVGGSFSSRMEAKDGSFGFDFGGIYSEVLPQEKIAYTMGDGRRCAVHFRPDNGGTAISSRFDAEEENSFDMQQMGWQAILNNFKAYTEAH